MQYRNRPQIRVKAGIQDIILEILAAFSLLALWIMAFYYYRDSPDTIPVHFNLNGEPDRYGNKMILFILAAMATALYTGFSYLQKVPHIYNYPVKITEENAEVQYRAAVGLMRMLKLMTSLVFVLVLVAIRYYDNQLQPWLIPVIFILVLSPILYYAIRVFTSRNRK